MLDYVVLNQVASISISNSTLFLILSSHSKNLLPLPLFLFLLLFLPLFIVIPLFILLFLFLPLFIFLFLFVLQLPYQQQVNDELPVIEQLLQGFVALGLKLVDPVDLLIERGVHLR